VSSDERLEPLSLASSLRIVSVRCSTMSWSSWERTPSPWIAASGPQSGENVLLVGVKTAALRVLFDRSP